MYKCEECNEAFDEPGSKKVCWEEYYGVTDLPGRNYGSIACCPECGCEEYEEAEDDM